MKLTTLEMLNEAAKPENKGVRYLETRWKHPFVDGKFYVIDSDELDNSRANTFLTWTWEREVKPLKGELTFDVKYDESGLNVLGEQWQAEAVRSVICDDQHDYTPICDKTFRVTIIAEDVTE